MPTNHNYSYSYSRDTTKDIVVPPIASSSWTTGDRLYAWTFNNQTFYTTVSDPSLLPPSSDSSVLSIYPDARDSDSLFDNNGNILNLSTFASTSYSFVESVYTGGSSDPASICLHYGGHSG